MLHALHSELMDRLVPKGLCSWVSSLLTLIMLTVQQNSFSADHTPFNHIILDCLFAVLDKIKQILADPEFYIWISILSFLPLYVNFMNLDFFIKKFTVYFFIVFLKSQIMDFLEVSHEFQFQKIECLIPQVLCTSTLCFMSSHIPQLALEVTMKWYLTFSKDGGHLQFAVFQSYQLTM